MDNQAASYEHEWLGNLRKEERWKEGRLAVVYLPQRERLALTGDLSLGGVKLAIHNEVPCVGEPVSVAIAFEMQIVDVCGTVQHVREMLWGSIVGVAFEETAQSYLARRYLRGVSEGKSSEGPR